MRKMCFPDSGSSSGTDETNTPEHTSRNSDEKFDTSTPESLSSDMFLLPQYTRQGQHLYTGYSEATHHITVRTENMYFKSRIFVALSLSNVNAFQNFTLNFDSIPRFTELMCR